MQDFASEIDWLRKKVSENPSSMLCARLAERYLTVKEYDRAMELAEKGAMLHPDYSTARLVLAKCYFERLQYDLANRYLKETLTVDPLHPAALKLAADLMKRLGDEAQARQMMSRLLEIDPADHTVAQQLDSVAPESPTDWSPAPSSEPMVGTTEENWNHDLGISPQETEPPIAFELETTLAEPTQPELAPAAPAEDPFDDFKTPANAAAPTTTDEVPQDETSEGRYDQDFEIDPRRYREEENRFTELLDTIFHPSLDEEERRAVEERSTIERIARSDDELDELIEEAPEPIEEPFSAPHAEPPLEEFRRASSPLDEIFKPDFDAEEFELPPEPEEIEAEESLPTDIFSFDQEAEPEQPRATPEKPTAAPPSDSVERDFHEFLSSLNIRDDVLKSEPPSSRTSEPPRRAHDFMTDLPDIDEELDDEDEGYAAEEDIPRTFGAAKSIESDEPSSDKHNRPRGKFFTPTLGEIYAAQGQYAKAITVFEGLLKKDPQNQVYRQKLEYLKKKLDEQQNQ